MFPPVGGATLQNTNTGGICGLWTVAPSNGPNIGGFGEHCTHRNPELRWRARSFNLSLSTFGRNVSRQDDSKRPMTVKPGGLEAQDTDSDQQFNLNTLAAPNITWQNSYNIDGDLLDSTVKLLLYSRGVIQGWDTDADQQFAGPVYLTDCDLSDSSVELVQYSSGTLDGWDTDADQQFAGPVYLTDRDLSDAGTELITLPFLPPLDQDVWSDRQWEPFQLDRDLSDGGTELVQYGRGVLDGWDTDADQQFAGPVYQLDRDLLDSSVELVQYGPGVLSGWDLDAEQQLSQLPGFQFDDPGNYTYPPIVTASSPLYVQVNGSAGTTNQTVTVQIVPNIGNVIVVSIGMVPTTTGILSITDNGNNVYNLVRAVLQGTNIKSVSYWAWVYNPMTLLTVQFTAAVTNSVVVAAEYAGVVCDGNDIQSTSASSATPGSAFVVEDALGTAVMFLATLGNGTWSPNTGNLRFSLASGSVLVVGLNDNSSSSSHQSVTNRVNISSAEPGALAILDLRAVSPAGVIDEFDSGVNVSPGVLYREHAEEEQWTNLIVLPPNVITEPWDTDSDQQLYFVSWPAGWCWTDDTPELVQYGAGVLDGWDTDADQQFAGPVYLTDRDLSDAGTELITLPFLPPLDQDIWSDRQWEPFQLDRDLSDGGTELVQYGPGVLDGWDSDADQQKPQIPLFGLDTLSDEGVEKITLPPIVTSFTWDDPAEQQKSMPDLFKDHLLDEGVELIQYGPGTLDGWDTDSDQQLSGPFFVVDRDIPDYSIELVQYGAGVLDGWDTDADQQKLQIPSFGLDTLLDEGVEKITLPPIVTSFTWDDPAEQQRPMPDTYKDHVSDEGVELIQYGPGVLSGWVLDAEQQISTNFYIGLIGPPWMGFDVQEDRDWPNLILYGPGVLDGWDTDADQQRLQLPVFGMDILSDEGVEKITLPPLVSSYTWDDPAEQQKSLPDVFKDHLTDEAVELIQYGPGVLDGWDTDADSQKPSDLYLTDRDLMDNGVEALVYGPGVLTGWDTDADAQKPTDLYQIDRDLMDSAVELVQYGAGVLSGWDSPPESQLPAVYVVRDLDEDRQWTNYIVLPPVPTASPLDDVFQQQSLFKIYLDSVEEQAKQIILPPFEADEQSRFILVLPVPSFQDWTQETNFLYSLISRRCFALFAGLLAAQAQEISSQLTGKSLVTAAVLTPQTAVLGGGIFV